MDRAETLRWCTGVAMDFGQDIIRSHLAYYTGGCQNPNCKTCVVITYLLPMVQEVLEESNASNS